PKTPKPLQFEKSLCMTQFKKIKIRQFYNIKKNKKVFLILYLRVDTMLSMKADSRSGASYQTSKEEIDKNLKQSINVDHEQHSKCS
ncbi:MAG: hypothetical protein ACKO96_48575, partial [Flammeovirgaceae bacterium]